jgi:hypothetical protein
MPPAYRIVIELEMVMLKLAFYRPISKLLFSLLRAAIRRPK